MSKIPVLRSATGETLIGALREVVVTLTMNSRPSKTPEKNLTALNIPTRKKQTCKKWKRNRKKFNEI